jgi:hypothetical protein
MTMELKCSHWLNAMCRQYPYPCTVCQLGPCREASPPGYVLPKDMKPPHGAGCLDASKSVPHLLLTKEEWQALVRDAGNFRWLLLSDWTVGPPLPGFMPGAEWGAGEVQKALDEAKAASKCTMPCPKCSEEAFQVTIEKSGSHPCEEGTNHWFQGFGVCSICAYAGEYSDSSV